MSESYGLDGAWEFMADGRAGVAVAVGRGRQRGVVREREESGGAAWEAESTYYDTAGNRLRAGMRVLSYDGEGRVAGATGDGVVSYEYDGDGRRVKATVNGVTTTFVYDVTGQLVAEYGGAGSVAAGVDAEHLTIWGRRGW